MSRVRHRLAWRWIPASIFEVEDFAVTLAGVVDSPALRERAAQLAGWVNGVVQVQEKLEVRS